MQKVEGSSPFSRFLKRPAFAGLLCFWGRCEDELVPHRLVRDDPPDPAAFVLSPDRMVDTNHTAMTYEIIELAYSDVLA
jgi:hypothetical protein